METPLLAVSIIVKNEEDNLPGCLEAIRKLGDLAAQISVYDTGSSDRTVEIARDAGCAVQEGYWDADFARAKNAAGSMCRAKWILSVDADERVTADAARLRSVLREGLTQGLTGADCAKVTLIDVRHGREVQVHNSFRLYRPTRCHWEGAVHERIVSSRGAADPVWFEPGRHVVALKHLGYEDAARLRQKLHRNFEIADRLIEQAGAVTDPEHLIHTLVDRARTRRSLGDNAAARADLERAWQMSSRRTYRTFGGEILVETLVEMQDLAAAEAVLATLRREDVSEPSYCDWLESRLATARGDSRRALELLRTIDVLPSALGVVVKPHLLLNDRMWAAIAEGEHLEAASCLVSLMAGQGVIHRKHGDLLVALTRSLPTAGLVELLIEHDRGHLDRIASELESSRDPGPSIALELRVRLRDNVSGGSLPSRVKSRPDFVAETLE